MTLQAELSGRLDAGALLSALASGLGDAAEDLAAVSPALPPASVSGAGAAAGGLDLSAIGGAAGRVAGALGASVQDLPAPDALLGPVRAGLAAVDAALSGDPEARLRALLDRVTAEFEGDAAGGTLGALRRLAESLGSAGELAALRGALAGLLSAAGARELPGGGIGGLVAGALAALEAIGRMMTLETALAEARRLAALMPDQLGPAAGGTGLAAIETAAAAARARLAALDPADDAAVAAALDALAAVRAAETAFLDALRRGMAFGEATLALADPSAVLARIETALEGLRGAAVAGIAPALGALAGTLGPLVAVDLSGAPAFTLADLLGRMETATTGLAAELAALDLAPLTAPLTEGLGSVTDLLGTVEAALDGVISAVEAALGTVRDAVAALPLDEIAGAIRAAVAQVAELLATLGDLLGGVQAALGTAAGAATDALGRAEAAVATFRTGLETAFGAARDFVDGLGLDRVAGELADGVAAVSDLIGRADMGPAFATASGAIDTTAGVIGKVPFALLPDEMEQDVVDLLRPIRAVDGAAFRAEILAALQIGPDGTFALGAELDTAVAAVQGKLDALSEALKALDPRGLATALDEALADIRDAIGRAAPALDLAPLTDALDAAKAAVAALDPADLLAPLRSGFDDVLARIDAFRPSALVAPLDAELDALRTKLLDLTRLRVWRDELDAARAEALALAARIDPATIEAPLRAAFADLDARLREGAGPDLLGPLGAILGGLFAGGGAPVAPAAFGRVVAWLRAERAGGAQLSALAQGLHDAIAETGRRVAAADPAAAGGRIAAAVAGLSGAVAALPPGAGRDRLATGVAALDVSAEFRALAPNADRYRTLLAGAETAAADLALRGFGEVDTVAATIRTGLAPLLPLLETPRTALGRLGFTRFGDGLPGLLSELFAVATPERLASLLQPVYAAFHARVASLLDAVIGPVRAAIDRLIGLVETFDLDRLAGALDGIQAAVRAEIAAFHPDALLGPALAAFETARADVAAFDPLGPVRGVLDALRATIARVLATLDAGALLRIPTEIYDGIAGALAAIDLAAILAPLRARLDAIAADVATGLEDTVAAFGRLQGALPDRVGSTSLSASASVGA